MMGHISDRTLDNLLDGSIDDAGELAIEEHVRRCDRCAHRLREWELLFPQIKSLIPTGEHPIMAEPAIAHAPRGLNVFVPDWTPPRAPHALPTKLAWGLVVILALGAAWLLFTRERTEGPTVAYMPETYEASEETGTTVDSGLGSGIAALPGSQTVVMESVPARQDSMLQRDTAPQRDSAPPPVVRPNAVTSPAAVATQPQAQPKRETPPAVSRVSEEQDVRVPSPDRDAPVTFPIRANPTTKAVARQTTPPVRPSTTDSAVKPPLPAQFQRVTLGEAIAHLGGTVRLIQGLTPEAVEVAQGSALPGADPAKAVVRVVYNAPEGRLIIDQQRTGRPGSREPNVAISTSPSGVSVAQWVDRGGFWVSLAGRVGQQTLLSIANRIR